MSFNSRQVRFLELEHQRHPFPSQQNFQNLALVLNKPQVLIQNWFAQRNGKQQTGKSNVMERPSAANHRIEFLRKEFAKNRYPTSSEFMFISQELGVTVQKVKIQRRKSSTPAVLGNSFAVAATAAGPPPLIPIHQISVERISSISNEMRQPCAVPPQQPFPLPMHCLQYSESSWNVQQFNSNVAFLQLCCQFVHLSYCPMY